MRATLPACEMDSSSSSMQALTSHTAPLLASVLQPCLEGTTDWDWRRPAEVLIVTTEWEVCVMLICPSRVTLKPPTHFTAATQQPSRDGHVVSFPGPARSHQGINIVYFPKTKFCLSLTQVSLSFWGSCAAIAWCVTAFCSRVCYARVWGLTHCRAVW